MHVRRIAVLGNHSPRQCGIATFTEDLAGALASDGSMPEVLVVAMNDGRTYAYPPQVQLTVEQHDLAAYDAAADWLNAKSIDVLSVQHEFGIFGGSAGSYLLTMLRKVRAPIITTLHTVLERYTPEQAAAVEELAALSTKLVVMSQRAVQFLVAQGVPRHKVSFIHHGIPDVTADPAEEKARLGLSGRAMVLTFGLLSPDKGIETAIRALPDVVRDVPNLSYLVLGATHPHIRAQHGEAYRDSLLQLAAELGVAEHVRFDNVFAELGGITRALAAADVCLVPYLNREQITSGTLSYALGNGKAVVSTPFWHAEEMLADGRGELVPFRNPAAIAEALRTLLLDPTRRAAMEARAREYGEQMRWPNVARTYLQVFGAARRPRAAVPQSFRMPALTLKHVAAFFDDTAMLQHATVAVPNPFEGYTTDDNARALHLAALAGDSPEAPAIARRTLSFLNYALDPATRRFHNFMSYSRQWLDEDGGENAQARTIRALVAATHGLQGTLGQTAREVLGRSLSSVEHLHSPRAQAIALIAISQHAEHDTPPPGWLAAADRYASNLLHRLEVSSVPTWPWFERYLSYSNAKLPHGLIAYGRVFGRAAALQAGLQTLAWLEEQQTAPDASFLPVGSERVYRTGEARPLWDGQPVEVYATVAAALEAHRATGDAAWLSSARRAVEWLLGRNALSAPLYDPDTGGCRDGLHRDRVNANQGAESTLALWLSVAEYDRAVALSMAAVNTGD